MELSDGVLRVEAQHPFLVVVHRLITIAAVAQVLVGIAVFITAAVGTGLAGRSRLTTTRGTVSRTGNADARCRPQGLPNQSPSAIDGNDRDAACGFRLDGFVGEQFGTLGLGPS